MRIWLLAALLIGLPLNDQFQQVDRSRLTIAPEIAGAINAAKVTVKGNAAPDIGQQISQAFLTLQASAMEGAVGTVYVPAGNYVFTNSISILAGAGQTGYRETLLCDPGAHLDYRGEGDALFSEPYKGLPGVQEANVRIIGCDISGTSSAKHGMHFKGFYGIYLQNNRVGGFTSSPFSAAAYYFDGAGVATCINNMAIGNYYGVSLTNNAATGTAANAIHWIGGFMQSDSNWGWADLYTAGESPIGESYGNSIEGVDFEGNGAPSVKSGDIMLQGTQNTTIQNNYEEISYGKDQILIDGTNLPVGLVRIIGNELDAPGSGNANVTVDGVVTDLNVEENQTHVAGSYFINGVSPTANIYVSNNGTSGAPNTGASNFIYTSRQVASFTTTPNRSDTLSIPGLTGTGVQCSVQATNSIAAGLKGIYVPPNSKSGAVTVYHEATAGGTFAVYCAIS